MIRSGSTVVYQAAAGILELRGIGQRGGYYEPPNPMPELPAQGWAVVKVPYLADREQRLIQAGAIALYSYRDLEESLASASRAFAVPAGDRWLWRALVQGARDEMGRFAALSLHRIPFADIRDRLGGVIRQIADWLPGRTLTAQELDSLTHDLSLAQQRARPRIYPSDPHTLLFGHHFD